MIPRQKKTGTRSGRLTHELACFRIITGFFVSSVLYSGYCILGMTDTESNRREVGNSRPRGQVFCRF